MTDQKFALVVRFVILDDAAFDVRPRTAETVGADVPWFNIRRDDRAGPCFSHRPCFDEGKTESIFKRGVQLAIHSSTEPETNHVLAIVR